MRKKIFAVVLTLTMMLTMAVTVLADTDPIADLNLAETVGSGIAEIASQVFGIIAVILPVALGLVGAVIAIRKGISLMRSLVS